MAGRTALRWGGATHVGRVRTVNEDNYLARDDLGLWAVADGMGGHRGGDVASELACQSLGRAFSERTVAGLVDAIDRANEAVYRTGSDDPDLTGMGTTMVALAVVAEHDDELLAVANVGDSRIYRYSVGELDQLTDDHSLVAELMREGTLSPEEAAVHPQRNIVTRVLGVSHDVPVDALTVEPVVGDRYVLCSDGLFNEVPEPTIAAVLRRLDDPAEVAAELVRLAVAGGGRDNVTVVVVDVIDDGGRAGAASAALAGAADGGGGSGLARHPDQRGTGGPANGDRDDGTAAGGTRRAAASGTATADPATSPTTAEEPQALGSAPAPTRARRRGDVAPVDARPRARRVTWRVLLFTLILLGLIGGALATIQWYGRSTYYVGFDGDRVAIYKGRPGGLLWLDPVLEEVTELERRRLPAETRDDLDAGKEQPSLADAHRYVERLEERADELDPDTPPTTGRPSTTTTAAGQPRTTTTRAGTATTASP